MNYKKLHNLLSRLYEQYNRAEYIHPDPLEFVHHYNSPQDQEIAGLFAALLAYGRVAQILKSTESILRVMGASPRDYILQSTNSRFEADFGSFQHRWTQGVDIIHLAQGIQGLLKDHDSIEKSFSSCLSDDSTNTVSALSLWIHSINPNGLKNSLLSDPAKGSACKRLHLYLRWMIRKDNVDPGPWTTIDPSLLVIPLDTHMFNIAQKLNMTKRKNPDGKAALEMTAAFKVLEPEDPVKYDFTLTRLGIRSEIDIQSFLDEMA